MATGTALSFRDLPVEICLKIFNGFPNFCTKTQQLLQLRLVSKHWHTMLREFPWRGHCETRHIAKAAISFPRMVKLYIDHDREQQCDLSPLSGCSQLSSVIVSTNDGLIYKQPEYVKLYLRDLPVNVKRLVLVNALIHEDNLEEADHSATTDFAPQSGPSDSAALPGSLAMLKVMYSSQMDSFYFSQHLSK